LEEAKSKSPIKHIENYLKPNKVHIIPEGDQDEERSMSESSNNGLFDRIDLLNSLQRKLI
jgi:hypothetical protein